MKVKDESDGSMRKGGGGRSDQQHIPAGVNGAEDVLLFRQAGMFKTLRGGQVRWSCRD